MFAVTRIPPSLIEDRLDARYNAPLAVETRKKILTSGIKSNSVGGLYNLVCGPFGSTLTSDEHDASGEVLLIQPTNISGDAFSDASSWRITKKALIEKDLKTYPEGTLLFARVGIYPHVGIIPKEAGLCTISSSMIAGLPKSDLDTHFLVAFFKCIYGNILLNAAQKVTAQPTIGTTEISNTMVPIPDEVAQKYIGDKVRQAEQLRAWTKRLEVKLALLENQIPTSKPVVGESKHSKATLEFLTENRLDARYYAKKHLDLYAQFNNEFESFGSICSSFKYGASIAANYVNSEGLPFIRGNALSPNRINQDDIVYLSKSLKDELKTAYVEEGDILITRSGTVGVTTHVAAEHARYWYGSFIIKCKLAANSYLPAYVSWYLNSWVGQQQFRRLENGAVQLNINTEELSSIAIWKAPQEFQTEIDKLLIEQISAVNLSKSLTSAAKTLVEALIDGQLTEQQLIQAQQALDDGDNSLDQAILSKLSNEGYAIEGATPLFSDIDELYHLLESAAQTEAEAEE